MDNIYIYIYIYILLIQYSLLDGNKGINSTCVFRKTLHCK